MEQLTGVPLQVTIQSNTASHKRNNTGSCGGANGEDANYEFLAPQDGYVEVSLVSGVYETTIYIRNADCTAELACFSETATAEPATVTIQVVANQRYVVVVDQTTGLLAGAYTLTVRYLN